MEKHERPHKSADKPTPQETLEKLRTMHGRLDHFPPSEIPARTAKSLHRNAKHLAPAVIAGGIAMNVVPLYAKDKQVPERIESAQRSSGQFALDSLVHDVVRSGAIERFNDKELSPVDIACLARNVYNEARGEDFEGQLATVLVVLARTQDRRFAHTPCGAVYQRNQFSWSNDVKILKAQKERSIDPIFKKLDGLLQGQNIPEAISLLASLLKLPEKTLYYKRTDWNENNEGEVRMSARSREMWKRLTPVRTIGNHTFYTD